MKSRGAKNIIFGLLNQVVTIAFGLILPRMFIMSYGSEVNGLISSVNQIFVYVALLEAGIGTASLQALYKTVGLKDKNATNEVLAATNHFYKKTGLYYFISVVILSIGYPLVVKSDIPFWTVFWVIFLNGMGGVINYLFQGKFRIFLRAVGRNYFLSNLSTVIYLLTSISKIILISLGYSVVTIYIAYFIINILQMSAIMVYMKKKYPWINLSVKPNFKAIASKNSVMVHQVANLVFSNTDVLILTMISGLKTVSIYSLYNSFFTMVKSMLFSLLDGIQFTLGQTFHSDFEKFKRMQDNFEATYMILTFWLYSILYVMILPFMRLYTEGITDINYIDPIIPLLFTLVYLLQGARGPMQLVCDYAGHFKQTQGQAITEMVINLSVSIVSVYYLGLYGVLLGTIAALLYRANAIIIYVNKNILKRSSFTTYKRWGWCFAFFLIIFFVEKRIAYVPQSYVSFFIMAIPVGIIITVMYFVGMIIFERKTFFWIYERTKSTVLSKLKK